MTDDSLFHPPAQPLDDPKAVRDVLVAAARERRVLTYSDLLAELGYQFSRPKMWIVVKTVGLVDAAGREAGEPELAVLVVRQSDHLPGDGWWKGHPHLLEHPALTAPVDPVAALRRLQERAFDFWRVDGEAPLNT